LSKRFRLSAPARSWWSSGFLDRLNDRGDIAPELITGDPDMQATIREHPGLRWKALNVMKHHGIVDDEADT